MKLRSASLDDVWNELQDAFAGDERLVARCIVGAATALYRSVHAAMLCGLRFSRVSTEWQLARRCRRRTRFEAAAFHVGDEPFNLTEAELNEAWQERSR